jgi:ribosomal protein S18 acetylase RimI-like enzyme
MNERTGANLSCMNERTIRAIDGRRLTVRPMTVDDADAVLAGFAALSPDSHRFRFFGAGQRLAPAVRADLVAVDEKHLVLLAFDDAGNLVAGARAVRHADAWSTADIAITVGDAHQRLGIGTKLLRLLAQQAMAAGIDRLVGHVLVDNSGGRNLLIRNGAMVSFSEPGVLWFEIPLERFRTPTVIAA